MKLRIDIGESQGITLVKLHGRLITPEESSWLRQRLKEQMAAQKTRFLVDLGDVTETDSGGLGTLVELAISARKWGGDLKLLNASEKIKQPFHLTRLYASFEWFTSEQEALASFG
ncbi:MAG: STAS domain-containing protein [Candidatus Acidoferrales bacterium]